MIWRRISKVAVVWALACTNAGWVAAQDRSAFLANHTINCARCVLSAASLDRRDLTGADLSGADLRGATFSHAILRGANLSGANLAGANLKRHDLSDANLSGANLQGASFHRAILRGANLADADARGANLNLALLTSANLQRANLAQALLFQVEASGADLRQVKLTAALMGGARLLVAKLDGADLTFADLWEARLTNASLRGAILTDVNLHAATLLRADMSGVSGERTEAPNQGSSAAPLAVKDKIIVGTSGRNETGRGFVAAYAADTGKMLWKFLVVPEAGQPGSETWADPRSLAYGGGGVWTEASFDPETNLAYFGTGNPVHMFDPQGRPGDNLYTSSVIALDVDTGKMKWYFQTIPNEAWDYDAVAITQLYDVNINGEVRKVISQTNRNGFFYTWDRTNGQFIKGEPFTTVNWTAGLDSKTGRPKDYDASKSIQDYAGKAVRYGKKAIDVRPAHYGMPTFMPNTFDPTRGLTYFNAMIGEGNYFNSRPADPAKGDPGTGFREIFCGSHTKDNAVEPIVRNVTNPNCKVSHGLLGGIAVSTGETVKKLDSYYPAYSGVLGTAGGLLFMGDIMGKISAYDKDTMKELWSFDTGTQFAGNPMTYSVNGKQYIALTLGGRPGRDEGSFPEAMALGQNVMVVVFGL